MPYLVAHSIEKYNIILILKSFDFEEIRQFRKFTESPYFNTNPSIIKLYETLIKFHPEFSNNSLNKEFIFSKIYGNREYNDSTMKNLLFDLLILAKKYLKQKSIENKTIESSDYLYEELFKRKLLGLLQKEIDDTRKVLSSNKFRDSLFFLNNFNLEVTNLNLNIVSNTAHVKLQALKSFEITSNAGKNLVFYFVSQIIQLYDTLIKQSKQNNIEPEQSFLGKFFKELNISKMIDFIHANMSEDDFNPIFFIYAALIEAFTDLKNEDYYLKFKHLLQQYSDNISLDEKNYLYSRLIDYCVIKSKISDYVVKYNNELILVYQEILEKEYYKHTVNPYLPIQLFRNILRAGLRAKKYDWTEGFIKVYSEKLNQNVKENMFNYSNAFMYFEKKEYEKALEYLSQVDLQLFTLKIDTRVLLLKTYYEINYTEPAYSLIDTFKHFISSNSTITHERKHMSKNFLKFAGRLLNIRDTQKISKLHVLKKEIENTEFVLEKDWLLEKIGDLDIRYKGAV